MQPGKRGRQLKTPNDVGRATREIINKLDTGVMSPDKAQAILAGLALAFSVMQRDSGATPAGNRQQTA